MKCKKQEDYKTEDISIQIKQFEGHGVATVHSTYFYIDFDKSNDFANEINNVIKRYCVGRPDPRGLPPGSLRPKPPPPKLKKDIK